MKKTKIAICYDFDHTLSTSDMQGFGLIQSFNMTPSDFWQKCRNYENSTGANYIMSYMYIVLQECYNNKIIPTREFFVSKGKEIEYFKGVKTWFSRINSFANEQNVEIEHYIISSGMKEIISGSTIAKYFKEIYACSYCYNEKGVACWPAQTIDYTAKTQYLYRINKGVLTPNDTRVNNFMSHEERPIPFENMIYIGDSETDIPAMKLIKNKGGTAIGVYESSSTDYYNALINQNRVNYIAKADYSENSELTKIIKEIIQSIKHKDNLKQINLSQKENEQTKQKKIRF
ncbi:MAG: haloacid dehalogenase-like hydrolase [Christensenellales bacterium]